MTHHEEEEEEGVRQSWLRPHATHLYVAGRAGRLIDDDAAASAAAATAAAAVCTRSPSASSIAPSRPTPHSSLPHIHVPIVVAAPSYRSSRCCRLDAVPRQRLRRLNGERVEHLLGQHSCRAGCADLTGERERVGAAPAAMRRDDDDVGHGHLGAVDGVGDGVGKRVGAVRARVLIVEAVGRDVHAAPHAAAVGTGRGGKLARERPSEGFCSQCRP